MSITILSSSLQTSNPYSDNLVTTSNKVMVTGDAIFHVSADILIYALVSECYSANNSVASTLQWAANNLGTTTIQTLSNASSSLANVGVGVSLMLNLGAVTNAPVVTNASGAGSLPWGTIRVAGGSDITTIIGVGSTTGTWKHYLRYVPLEQGAVVTPAF